MTDEAFSIKDAGGVPLYNLLDVDGMRINTLGKPATVTAEIIRKIKTLKLRDDDVMLCTPPKSGTHWGFEIVSMLLKGKAENTPIPKIRLMLANCSEESMDLIPSPRVLNTHCPFNMLPREMKEKKTKVVLILRNPKDTVVSSYHHHRGMTLVGYKGKFEDYLPLFVEEKLEYSGWFKYVLGFEKAMEEAELPIHLTFFEDLKENGLEEIKKIAKFLKVPADEELCKAIHDKCEFKKMAVDKAYEPRIADKAFTNGFSMFRKGQIGDWKNYFTVAQREAFDQLYKTRMKTSTLQFRYESS